MLFFALTEANRWRPGIGDPTVMGWITVAGYLLASFLAVRTAAAWRAFSKQTAVSPDATAIRQVLFWGLLCVFLLGLGVNKQLDLQTWFTLAGRRIAQRQGWYEHRRAAQAIFIAIVVLLGLASFRFLLWLNLRSTNHLALLGSAFLGAFIIIRASSFHHVDVLLGVVIGGVKVNWMLELGGILLLTIAPLIGGPPPLPALSQPQ